MFIRPGDPILSLGYFKKIYSIFIFIITYYEISGITGRVLFTNYGKLYQVYLNVWGEKK